MASWYITCTRPTIRRCVFVSSFRERGAPIPNTCVSNVSPRTALALLARVGVEKDSTSELLAINYKIDSISNYGCIVAPFVFSNRFVLPPNYSTPVVHSSPVKLYSQSILQKSHANIIVHSMNIEYAFGWIGEQ
jgi:hypothetical protein